MSDLLRWLPGLVFAAFLAAGPAPAAEPDPDGALVKTARGLFAGLRTETLPNGLRVYLLPVPGSPVVTTMVAYKVGSGDEEKDQTGLSHYLEHLLFKGTETLMPGDIDRATQRNGGRSNAYTDEDMTVYYFDFAADRWEIGLGIEADRMRNVRIDEKHEFQQEKGAVVVPSEAVHWEGCCHVVFVADRGFDRPDGFKVFHVRKIRPGAKDVSHAKRKHRKNRRSSAWIPAFAGMTFRQSRVRVANAGQIVTSPAHPPSPPDCADPCRLPACWRACPTTPSAGCPRCVRRH